MIEEKSISAVDSALKNSSIFLFFSLVNRGIPFLLLPLLTEHIDPVGYGIIAVMALVTSLSMPLIGFCSNSVLFQRFFKSDRLERANFLADAYKIIFINTCLFLGLSFLLGDYIEIFLKVPLGWVQVAIICASAGMITTLTTEIFLLQRNAVRYGVFMTLTALLNASLAILLVVVYEQSWQGRGWSLLITGIIMASISIAVVYQSGGLRGSRIKFSSQGSSIVKLGSLLVPSAIAGWALAMTDRLFLTSMTGLEVVGIYAVGAMIAQIADIFLNAFARVAHPYIAQYGLSEAPLHRIYIARGIYLYGLVAFLTVAGLAFLAPVIIDLMIDARFSEAVKVVVWIALGYGFSNVGGIFLSLLLIKEKNSLTVYISSVTFCFSVSCAYFLIGQFGMIGAAWVNALAGLFNMVVILVFCQVHNPLPWFDKRVFGIGADVR